MALTTGGQLYGWGWNKVDIIFIFNVPHIM